MSDAVSPHIGPTALTSSATYREIRQQPEVWRETARIVRSQRGLDAFLAPQLARRDLRIVFTGAGTSAFIGQIAAPALVVLC
jgi:tagatose-6-phosphate ketose/aldose isomerase